MTTAVHPPAPQKAVVCGPDRPHGEDRDADPGPSTCTAPVRPAKGDGGILRHTRRASAGAGGLGHFIGRCIGRMDVQEEGV